MIEIIDGTGRIAIEKNLSFGKEELYTMNISGLNPGAYRIVVSTTGGQPVARATFVKK